MSKKDLGNADAGYEGLDFEHVLQAHLACGILAVDSTNGTITLTDEAARALHLPTDQAPRTLDALPAPLLSLIREVQNSGRPFTNCQIVFHPKKGGPITLLITALPLAPGKPSGDLVMMVKDVSSAAKIEFNLRRLDRLASVGTLSASMAHEIKNALVAIKAFADLLLEKHPDADLASTVRRELERVDAIASQMLKFSAPAQPAFSDVRLHEILEHSLRLVKHRVGQKVISFRCEFGASKDAFRGDDHQMEQVFVNLLLNGVEAMGPEGTLTVSTDVVSEDHRGERREGDGGAKRLRVRIADTGGGISPEHVAHIFDPFFTTKPYGTGLGLAVTRRIVEEHKGVIQVESNPGQGTTFIVLLPAS